MATGFEPIKTQVNNSSLEFKFNIGAIRYKLECTLCLSYGTFISGILESGSECRLVFGLGQLCPLCIEICF